MKKRHAGLVFVLITGIALGWVLKPGNEGNANQEGQALNSSVEKRRETRDGESDFNENEVSNYIQKIEELEARLGRLEPLRDQLEKQHDANTRGLRKHHEEELERLDSIVFLTPQQIESLKQVFYVREQVQSIQSRKVLALITEEEAKELLTALPSLQHPRNIFAEILDKDQMVLLQEAEYREQRENKKRGAAITVERLTKNIVLDRNQKNQLIEQYLDVHAGPSSEYSKYIAPEFEDLQVADVVKAEISLASKVLTEEQLITYIENHLNRY